MLHTALAPRPAASARGGTAAAAGAAAAAAPDLPLPPGDSGVQVDSAPMVLAALPKYPGGIEAVAAHHSVMFTAMFRCSAAGGKREEGRACLCLMPWLRRCRRMLAGGRRARQAVALVVQPGQALVHMGVAQQPNPPAAQRRMSGLQGAQLGAQAARGALPMAPAAASFAPPMGVAGVQRVAAAAVALSSSRSVSRRLHPGQGLAALEAGGKLGCLVRRGALQLWGVCQLQVHQLLGQRRGGSQGGSRTSGLSGEARVQAARQVAAAAARSSSRLMPRRGASRGHAQGSRELATCA